LRTRGHRVCFDRVTIAETENSVMIMEQADMLIMGCKTILPAIQWVSGTYISSAEISEPSL
jgi:hypothetical protein